MAHWLGDNYALWEYLKYSIQGVLQFQLFQASPQNPFPKHASF